MLTVSHAHFRHRVRITDMRGVAVTMPCATMDQKNRAKPEKYP